MPKDIRYLKGVGEKRAELFAKKGIKTVEDLLYYFPRSHEDRTEKKDIADCVEGETVCVSITVFSPVRETRVRRNMLISTMIVSDESGVLNVVWYNNRYVKNQFKTGDKYVLYGKVTKNRGKLEMVNPVCEQEGKERFTGKNSTALSAYKRTDAENFTVDNGACNKGSWTNGGIYSVRYKRKISHCRA